MKKSLTLSLFILFVCSLFVLVSCGSEPPVQTPESQQPVPVSEQPPVEQVPISEEPSVIVPVQEVQQAQETEAAPSPRTVRPIPRITETPTPAVQVSQEPKAIVSFLYGDVIRIRDGKREALDIGMELLQDDSLEVGPSSLCELQVGDSATLRIQENSQLSMRVLVLTPDRTAVRLGMETGGVLSKISSLKTQDSYEIRTRTAVAGVRGTEFLARVRDDGSSDIAVREGRVSVRPTVEEVEDVVEQAITQAPLAQEIAVVLETRAVQVQPEQQVRVAERTEPVGDAQTPAQAAAQTARAEESQALAQTLRTIVTIEPETTDEARAEAVQSFAQSLERITLPPPSVENLGQENTQELAEIETIQPVQVVARVQEEETNPLIPLRIRVSPPDAQIFLNNRLVGQGSFSRLFEFGSAHTLSFQHPDYEDQEFGIVLNVSSGRNLDIELSRILPEDGDDSQDDPDQEASQEDASSTPEAAPADEAQAQRQDQNQTQQPQEAPVVHEVVKIPFTITALPRDAQILLQGRVVATGTYRGEAEEDAVLSIALRKPGFGSQEHQIRVTPDLPTLTYELEPRPIHARVMLESNPLVRGVAVSGSTVIGVDSQGALSAVTPDGQVVWKVATKNAPNENAVPVVAGTHVWLSGSHELVGVEIQSGRIVHRRDLTDGMVHFFGERSLSEGNQLWYPARNELIRMDSRTGDILGTVTLPQSSTMSAALMPTSLVIATDNGDLLIISKATGNVERTIPTPAMQPVAHAPGIWQNTAYVIGRRGTAVGVDLAEGSVAWSVDLPGGSYVDPVVGSAGVYFYVDGRLFAYSHQGQELFAPVSGVGAAPGYLFGELYIPLTSGRLIIADPTTGRTRRTLDLGEALTTQPAQAGDFVALGTTAGRIILVDPRGIME